MKVCAWWKNKLLALSPDRFGFMESLSDLADNASLMIRPELMNQGANLLRRPTTTGAATGRQTDPRVSMAGGGGCFILGGAKGRMFRAKGFPSLGSGSPMTGLRRYTREGRSRGRPLMRFWWAGWSDRRVWDTGEISSKPVFLFFPRRPQPFRRRPRL